MPGLVLFQLSYTRPIDIFIHSIFVGEGRGGLSPTTPPSYTGHSRAPPFPPHLTHPSHYPRSSPLPLHSLWGVGHGTTVVAGFSTMGPRRDIDENVWLRPGIEPGSPDLEIGTLPIELHPAKEGKRKKKKKYLLRNRHKR